MGRAADWLTGQRRTVATAWRGTTLPQRLLLAAGAAGTGYGGWLVLEQVLAGVLSPVGFLAWWLGGPVVVDLVAVPVVVVLAIGLGRLAPVAWRAAVDAAALVSVLLLLVAGPVLTGIGRRADNPSLLDRDYATGFVALLLLVWTGFGVANAIALHRARRRLRR